MSIKINIYEKSIQDTVSFIEKMNIEKTFSNSIRKIINLHNKGVSMLYRNQYTKRDFVLKDVTRWSNYYNISDLSSNIKETKARLPYQQIVKKSEKINNSSSDLREEKYVWNNQLKNLEEHHDSLNSKDEKAINNDAMKILKSAVELIDESLDMNKNAYNTVQSLRNKFDIEKHFIFQEKIVFKQIVKHFIANLKEYSSKMFNKPVSISINIDSLFKKMQDNKKETFEKTLVEFIQSKFMECAMIIDSPYHTIDITLNGSGITISGKKYNKEKLDKLQEIDNKVNNLFNENEGLSYSLRLIEFIANSTKKPKLSMREKDTELKLKDSIIKGLSYRLNTNYTNDVREELLNLYKKRDSLQVGLYNQYFGIEDAKQHVEDDFQIKVHTIKKKNKKDTSLDLYLERMNIEMNTPEYSTVLDKIESNKYLLKV